MRMVLTYETDGDRHVGPAVRLFGTRNAEMGGISASFGIDSSGRFQ